MTRREARARDELEARAARAAHRRRPRGSTHAIVTTIIANFALPASALITAPILARTLGPASRGEVTAVCAPLNLAVLLLSAGQWDASSFFGADRRRGAGAILRASGLISLATAVVGIAALIALNPVLLSRHRQVAGLAVALSFLLLVYLPANSVRGLLLGRQDFRALNVEKWSAVVLRLLLIVAFALGGLLSTTSAAWITQGSVAFAALLLPIFLRRSVRAAGGQGASAATTLREVSSYGLRVWGGGLSVVLIYRADQAIMSPLTTAAQLGFYSVAASIAEVPTGAFAALRDIGFSKSAAGAPQGHSGFLAGACRASVLVGVPAIVVATFVLPPLVTVVFGHDFSPAAPMMQVLVVAALPAGLSSICGAGMNALDRPGTLSLVQAGVAVVNVALTVVLVPGHGGMGAALATLVGYGLLAVVTMGLFARLSATPLRSLLVPTRADAVALLSVVRPRAA